MNDLRWGRLDKRLEDVNREVSCNTNMLIHRHITMLNVTIGGIWEGFGVGRGEARD